GRSGGCAVREVGSSMPANAVGCDRGFTAKESTCTSAPSRRGRGDARLCLGGDRGVFLEEARGALQVFLAAAVFVQLDGAQHVGVGSVQLDQLLKGWRLVRD